MATDWKSILTNVNIAYQGSATRDKLGEIKSIIDKQSQQAREQVEYEELKERMAKISLAIFDTRINDLVELRSKEKVELFPELIPSNTLNYLEWTKTFAIDIACLLVLEVSYEVIRLGVFGSQAMLDQRYFNMPMDKMINTGESNCQTENKYSKNPLTLIRKYPITSAEAYKSKIKEVWNVVLKCGIPFSWLSPFQDRCFLASDEFVAKFFESNPLSDEEKATRFSEYFAFEKAMKGRIEKQLQKDKRREAIRADKEKLSRRQLNLVGAPC